MRLKNKKYSIEYSFVNGYKSFRTSGHDSGITIFIKKRLFGFLWWVLVKDEDGLPVTYNHDYNAEAFMNGVIQYRDQIHREYKIENNQTITTSVRPMTDEDAYERISNYVEKSTGERPDVACVKRAWEFDGKEYCLEAAKYASLWHQIYMSGGKKIWET